MIFQQGFGYTARSLFYGILGQETPTVTPPGITPQITPAAPPPAVVTPVVAPLPTPAIETPVQIVTPTVTPVTPAPTPVVTPAAKPGKPAYPGTGAAYEKYLADRAAWILKRSSGYEYEWGISAAKMQQVVSDAAEYEYRTSKYNIPLSEWQRKIGEVAADWDFYAGMTRSQAQAETRRLRTKKETDIKAAFQKPFKASIDKRVSQLKQSWQVGQARKTVPASMMESWIESAARSAIRQVEDDPRFQERRPGGLLEDYFIYYMREYLGRMTYEQLIAETITPEYYRRLGLQLFNKSNVYISEAAPAATPVQLVTPTVTPAATPAVTPPATPPVTPAPRRLTSAVISQIVLRHVSKIKLVRRGGRYVREVTPEGYRQLVSAIVADIVSWLQGLSGFGQVTPTVDQETMRQIAEGVELALRQMGVQVAEVTPAITPVPTPTPTPVVREIILTPTAAPVVTPPTEYDTREDVIRRTIEAIFPKHGLADRVSPGRYPAIYLSSVKRNELIGDLVYESQKQGRAARVYMRVAGGLPGLSRDEADAILTDRNVLLERPREITPAYITPVATPPQITPAVTPQITPVLPTLDEWARTAPVFLNYAACMEAARAATGRVPDRFEHCTCVEDAVTRAVDNALEEADVTTKAITPDKYAALVADAVNVGNQMIAQRSYAPTIPGRRVRFRR